MAALLSVVSLVVGCKLMFSAKYHIVGVVLWGISCGLWKVAAH